MINSCEIKFAARWTTSYEDEILIINVDGYIGDSTRSEVEYAKSTRKSIRYLFHYVWIIQRWLLQYSRASYSRKCCCRCCHLWSPYNIDYAEWDKNFDLFSALGLCKQLLKPDGNLILFQGYSNVCETKQFLDHHYRFQNWVIWDRIMRTRKRIPMLLHIQWSRCMTECLKMILSRLLISGQITRNKY